MSENVVVTLVTVSLSVVIASDTVKIARSRRPEDTPCPSVEGAWLSSNMETVFEIRATSTDGRLDLCAVGSDWTGAMEVLFGTGGPVSASISQSETGITATFVGHCRVVDGMDSMIGTLTNDTVDRTGWTRCTRMTVRDVITVRRVVRRRNDGHGLLKR